jgi:hypothetical protein
MTYGAKEDPLEACEVLVYWSFSTIISCICPYKLAHVLKSMDFK